MPDIYHDFPIVASSDKIFQAISSEDGLNAWWTRRSAGQPEAGASYQLWFAPEYDWRGIVTACKESRALEWEITEADGDWTGTRVGFELLPPKFTLTELQHLYEAVLETELDKRNFRKKILSMNLLVDLDETQEGVAHRPAKLYEFDQAWYEKLVNEGFSFELKETRRKAMAGL